MKPHKRAVTPSDKLSAGTPTSDPDGNIHRVPRPTLGTVARIVGCSPAAVSMALRGHPGVSEETRGRVVSAAQEIGYRPNAFAAYLAGQRQNHPNAKTHPNLAVLVGHHDADPRNVVPHYATILGALHQRATELGYALDEFWAFDPEISSGRLERILASRSIRGLVFLSFRADDFTALGLGFHRYCLAHANAPASVARCHHPYVDYYGGVRGLLRELHRAGHRRIGLALDAGVNQFHEARITAAYREYQSEIPQESNVPILLTDGHDPKALKLELGSWIASHSPDAIIAWSTSTLRYAEWFQDEGLAVGLPYYDLNASAYRAEAGIIGLTEPHEEMASGAIDLLVRLIHRNETGFPRTKEQSTFLPRQVGLDLETR